MGPLDNHVAIRSGEEQYFPLAEFAPYRLRQQVASLVGHADATLVSSCIKAVYTGEKRPPRAGEWFLSGATVAAYQTPNDLTDHYHIARLVWIEKAVDLIPHDIEPLAAEETHATP